MNIQEIFDKNRLIYLKHLSVEIHEVIISLNANHGDAINALMANVCERLLILQDKSLVEKCILQLDFALAIMSETS